MLLVDTEGHTQLADTFLGVKSSFVCLQFRERYKFISLNERHISKNSAQCQDNV